MYWETLASALIIKSYTVKYFKSCIRNPVFIIICLKNFHFLVKSKWHLSGMAFIPLKLLKNGFDDFSNQLITSSGVFPMQYGVLSSA